MFSHYGCEDEQAQESSHPLELCVCVAEWPCQKIKMSWIPMAAGLFSSRPLLHRQIFEEEEECFVQLWLCDQPAFLSNQVEQSLWLASVCCQRGETPVPGVRKEMVVSVLCRQT